MSQKTLTEGVDYYYEEVSGTRYRVFTEHYHLSRGFCCKNNCRHCAYGFKKTTMKQTSLEQFKSLVDSHYLSLKGYIKQCDNNKVTLTDYENYAWGKNPDLEPLFESPMQLPIKKMDVTYSEKECAFNIVLHLK